MPKLCFGKLILSLVETLWFQQFSIDLLKYYKTSKYTYKGHAPVKIL